MLSLLLRILASPSHFIGIVKIERLRRLWFYVERRQFSVIGDRVRRLLDIRVSRPSPLALYPVAELPARLEFQKNDKPVVSIVVPVFNAWQTTYSCLASILANSATVAYEVIVADDCSSDETRNIAHHVSNIRTIVNSANLGFLKNCNNAARHATGQYLVFLNNDTNVQPGWLAALVELMERDSSVGLAGSKLLYPDGRLQEAGSIIFKDGGGWNYGRNDVADRPEYNYLKEVDYVTGAAIMVRKILWDQIGGFDERFVPAYYEDADLAFEVRRRGFRVVYEPGSRVVHLEGVSHGTSVASGTKAYQVVNQSRFRDKWRTLLDAEHGAGVEERGVEVLFTARDRSRSKKTVLFIDDSVPVHDRDAGSRSSFQYLQLMVEMGYNVKFLADDLVQREPYTGQLQQMGIEVLYGRWYERGWKRWIAGCGSHIDYVYLSRPQVAIKYLETIKRHTAARLLYCGHDLHYLREARHYAVERKKVYLKSARKWEKIEGRIVKNVDVSYFFSTYEVSEIKKKFPACNAATIPLFLFDEARLNDSGRPGFAARAGLLFVGGFMHAPNIDAVRWFVKDVFPLVRAKLPGIEFVVVGAGAPPEIKQLAGNGVVIAGRLSDEALERQYNERRLVVAPLRFGAGVKGKIVEAMRFGVPTVTTSTGAEGIGNASSFLFISDDAAAFADEVIKAYTGAERWTHAAERAIRAVGEQYTKKAAREILLRDMPLQGLSNASAAD